jgi:peroxiredoxin (alkyl hydroperoxide reductase subunit C)
MDEIIRQIHVLQHVRATNGAEVCPVGWKFGMIHGPALVGNVWKEWSLLKDH